MASDLTWQDCVDRVGELFEIVDDGAFTSWECEFINDMVEYGENGRLFSEAQKEKIEELHERECR